MILFDKIDVKINETGILANSATLDSSNSLLPIYPIGRVGDVSETPNGPLNTVASISYLMEMNKEPNLIIVDTIKTLLDDSAFNSASLSIGGLSGEGYLSNLSINSTPNSPIEVDVSYVIFNGISGTFEAKADEVSGDFETRSIGHSWGFVVNSNSGYREEPTLDFSYSFQANWRPNYKVGSTVPYAVSLDSAEENISFIRDNYSEIFYSGQQAAGVLVDTSVNDHIQIKDIGLACDGNGIDALNETGNIKTFNLDNAKISSNQISVGLDQIALSRFNIRKFY